MPLYLYQCPKCGIRSEIQMTICELDTFMEYCKTCPKIKLRQIITAPNIITGSYTGREQLNVPINIIEKQIDGSYNVTRIGKKSDIEND